jgi:predicted enzyme related to lactoylglutathione lyase
MRWRGVNHIELSTLDYDASVAFYDQMFGWLGYRSFSTLDIGYPTGPDWGAAGPCGAAGGLAPSCPVGEKPPRD